MAAALAATATSSGYSAVYGPEAEARTSFQKRLFTSMREVHVKAKTNEFLKNLIEKKMACSKAYVGYLCNLFWLHRSLEIVQGEIIKKYGECGFVFSGLYRSEQLLADIKLWSIFNPTATKFADKDSHSEEFLKNVESFVQPCAREFAKQLEGLPEPLVATGAMYALYGTIMSGGQDVKEGVEVAFFNRLIDKIQEHLDGAEAEKSKAAGGAGVEKAPVVDLEATELKAEVLQKVINELSKEDLGVVKDGAPEEALRVIRASKEARKYAKESVSFFSFGPDFNISDFKQNIWRLALDEASERFRLEGDLEQQIKEKCSAAIGVVLDSIASLLRNLAKGGI